MASHGAPPAVHPVDRLLGTSPAIVTLRTQIRQLARFDTLENPAVPTLLLLGETGTGKSLVARIVHDSGPRARGPFLEVNCATLPETMLEAELFGFEAGAFTDARRAKPGLFEAAAGGTLFLDEIDAVPLALQGKLLTALESKRVRRVGAVTDQVVDVKLIAATNADLGQRVAAGQLRADLYHRLAVVVLTLPPLRERGADVVELAQAQLARLAAAHGLAPKRLHTDAAQWLMHYPWPGNVRELGHLLERVTLLHAEDDIDAATLARWSQVLPGSTHEPAPPASDPVPLPAVSTEVGQLQEALTRAGGNLAQTARLLGLSRDQLRTRMRRYGLTRPRLTPLPPAPPMPSVGPSAHQPAPPENVPAPAPAHASAADPVSPASADTPSSLVVTPADHSAPTPGEPGLPAAERRQLTVLFCDLVDSTVLAGRLDPEEWRTLVQRYHATCAEVMAPFEGCIAQYLGEGILVYFGYPQAHEDDAQRAVRAGLALVAAMARLRVQADLAVRLDQPLAVRIGIHTGLVVIGAVGAAGHQEALALGEAPHVAARLQSVAAPGTVVCSAATAHLVRGYVTLQALEAQALKGVATPVQVYQVSGARGARSRLEVSGMHGLTPLVGRDTEVALLQERWGQVQDGHGQVVVLSGEAGIGKSRLVQVIREQVVGRAATHLPGQCSPYHQHSPFAPLIDALERRLGWPDNAPPAARLAVLEQHLASLGLSLPAVLPWLAALLSLPLPSPAPPLALTPQQHKQKTLDALLLWLVQEAELRPVLLVVEDLHWVDPSTLEWLTLVLDQVPTTPLYVLCTCRPECSLPWGPRAYLTPLTLARLPRPHVERLVLAVAGGRPLPHEVVQQVVIQTDGVPLFIEELTKMVLESDQLQEPVNISTPMVLLPPLAIPSTLQDSLMARPDRLGSAKAVAQLGATIGRQFAYAVLQAVAPGDEAVLQQELARLVAAELLYQRGVPPQATYRFKHALIQEAAYQSLLKRTRQQHHRQIAQTLMERFPEVATTQPEVLAQHYTEAGLATQAVEYWQRAGQQAAEHAAYAEAVTHLTKGLEVLQSLPQTPARLQQELTLHLALGGPLMAVKGMSAPDVHHTYARAHEICQHVADVPQRALALHGVWLFLLVTGALQTAQEVAEHLLGLAHEQHDPVLLLGAHRALTATFHARGEITQAYAHAQQGRRLYNLEQHRTLGLRYGYDPGVLCYGTGATLLWILGFPEQALMWSQETLALSQAVAHPPSQAMALHMVTVVHLSLGEATAACRLAETMMTLATESAQIHYIAEGRILWGRALATLGQQEEGIRQLRQGLESLQALGVTRRRPYFLTLLAEVYADAGQAEVGRHVLAEAHAVAVHTGEYYYASEIHRLTGVFVLTGGAAWHAEAEAHFQQALQIARRQQAKSLELRAAMSLARLWRQQGKRAEARQLLAEVYNWFTEGFDTADLQEAQALLATLR